MTSQLVSGGCRRDTVKLSRLQVNIQKVVRNHDGQKWTQLDQVDNRFYSTIQPRTHPTYIMKIGVWLSIWEFFDNLSQKSDQTTHQHSHQFLKTLNGNHWIGSSSPVTNPSGKLTNINVT